MTHSVKIRYHLVVCNKSHCAQIITSASKLLSVLQSCNKLDIGILDTKC